MPRMYTQQGMTQLQASTELAEQWQTQMNTALSEEDMRFGFGGVRMSNWLHSTTYPTATNGRATDDYEAIRKPQWQIGVPRWVNFHCMCCWVRKWRLKCGYVVSTRADLVSLLDALHAAFSRGRWTRCPTKTVSGPRRTSRGTPTTTTEQNLMPHCTLLPRLSHERRCAKALLCIYACIFLTSDAEHDADQRRWLQLAR